MHVHVCSSACFAAETLGEVAQACWSHAGRNDVAGRGHVASGQSSVNGGFFSIAILDYWRVL